MRNLPQFAKIPQGISTVLPCYCIGFHVLLWKLRATSLLVVLVPRLGGLGRQNFFSQISAFSKDAASCSQRCSRHYTGTSQCDAARARGVVENLFLRRFRPSVDSPSKSQWGSILLLVRDLAPYSTPLLLRTLSP